MANDDRQIDGARLSVPIGAVISLTIILLGLLGAMATGTWATARAFSRVEAKLDAVSDQALNVRYFTRTEASRWHRDLERTLQKSGLHIEFPPPLDPADSIPPPR